MLSSTAATNIRHRAIKKALAEAGADPFDIAAQALARNEELQAQVEMLQRIVNRR
jgi:formiminotetrahydrofolate cyclodeaminase